MKIIILLLNTVISSSGSLRIPSIILLILPSMRSMIRISNLVEINNT